MRLRDHLLPTILILLTAVPAAADWEPGDAAVWAQLPDLDTTGMDVNATYDGSYLYTLIDDFESITPGYLTDIHVWGSWLGDELPYSGDPGDVGFTLKLRAGYPVGEPGDPHYPGQIIWSMDFDPGEFEVIQYADGLAEGWLDPPDAYQPPPADTICWQYSFAIPRDEAHHLEGSVEQPRHYWLSIEAEPGYGNAVFGVKTSTDSRADGAMFRETWSGYWEDLLYTPGHPWGGQEIDLAFVLALEPMDMGDAPDPDYPTLLANDGPRHVIEEGFFMGQHIDADPDGQPSWNAMGDDVEMPYVLDDEDGVSFSALVPGTSATMHVHTPTTGMIDAWIDFDGNGSWGDPDEQVCASHPATVGGDTISFLVPPTPGSDILQTFARVRFSHEGGLSYDGIYPDGRTPFGEVEDYRVTIHAHPDENDFGDAPDPTYPTLRASGGAEHVPGPLCLGGWGDGEPDGQPDPDALGDDLDGEEDDENGVGIGTLRPGRPARVQYSATAPGHLDAWIDFDGNGDWNGPEEHVIVSEPVRRGSGESIIQVPADAIPDAFTFARFRVSYLGGLEPGGPYPGGMLPDGEVEDYKVYIAGDNTYKWEQAPDLSIEAVAVNADGTSLLADDFLCYQTGPLTDITVWGAWYQDLLPFGGDPTEVGFTLAIHADIPADGQFPYSRPGDLLWSRVVQPGAFTAEVFAQGAEGWYDVPSFYEHPGDWTCWQYDFNIPAGEAFEQQGHPFEPIVYWLSVQTQPLDQTTRWGWKASIEHWNDSAVFGFGSEPFDDIWYELEYPHEHPYAYQPMDLAFRIFQGGFSSAPEGATPDAPRRTGLLGNSPNPFNPMTEIRYVMPAGGGDVRLEIYDLLGRRIATLVDGFVEAGERTATWTGRDDRGAEAPSGVYVYRLRGAGLDQSMKMLLLR